MATQEHVMFPCPHCGAYVHPFVGSDITAYGREWGCWEETNAGSTVQLAKHCPNCGGKITVTCPICRLPHLLGFKFCPVQGKSLEEYERERDEAQREGIEQQKRDAAALQLRKEYEELRDQITNRLWNEAFLPHLLYRLGMLALFALTLWFSYEYFQPSGFGFVVWILAALVASCLPSTILYLWWVNVNIFKKADAEAEANFASGILKSPP